MRADIDEGESLMAYYVIKTRSWHHKRCHPCADTQHMLIAIATCMPPIIDVPLPLQANQKIFINADVPPLEDMSEELERIKSRIAQSKRVERSDIMQPPRQQDASLNPTMSVSGSESKQATKGRSQTERVKEKTASAGDTKSSSFGGFKKGFLVSSSDSSKPRPKREPPAPSKKTTPAAASSVKETGSENESDIPFIRPKDKAKSSLEFPEVQQAMKEAFPLLQSKGGHTTIKSILLLL